MLFHMSLWLNVLFPLNIWWIVLEHVSPSPITQYGNFIFNSWYIRYNHETSRNVHQKSIIGRTELIWFFTIIWSTGILFDYLVLFIGIYIQYYTNKPKSPYINNRKELNESKRIILVRFPSLIRIIEILQAQSNKNQFVKGEWSK